MTSFIGMYRYNDCFYTGTELQPDTLSLFIKKDKNSLLICNAEPTANLIGKCVPIVGSFTGIVRIKNSAKEIFNHIKNKDHSSSDVLWNKIKNLFRGIAETIPL